MSKSGQLRQAHMTSTAGIPMLPPSDAVVVLHPSPDVDISPMLREELARLRGLRRTYNAAKECVAKSGAEIARLEEAIADAEAQLASSRQALTNFLAEVGVRAECSMTRTTNKSTLT